MLRLLQVLINSRRWVMQIFIGSAKLHEEAKDAGILDGVNDGNMRQLR